MSSFKKIKKASKYADCKNSGKGSLLKYYGVKTERRVVDDIYTTGATVDEAARILKKAGADRVYFLVIAIGSGG